MPTAVKTFAANAFAALLKKSGVEHAGIHARAHKRPPDPGALLGGFNVHLRAELTGAPDSLLDADKLAKGVGTALRAAGFHRCRVFVAIEVTVR